MTTYYSTTSQYINDQLERVDLLIKRVLYSAANYDLIDGGYILSREMVHSLLDEKESKNINDQNCDEYSHLIEKKETQIEERLQNTLKNDNKFRIKYFYTTFDLIPLEFDIFLICMAPCINIKYEKVYAYIQKDSRKTYPTIDCIYKLLNITIDEQFIINELISEVSTLRSLQLIDFIQQEKNTSQSPLSIPLKADMRIVNYLLGSNEYDENIINYTDIYENINLIDDLFISEDLKTNLKYIADHITSLNGRKIDMIFSFLGTSDDLKKKAASAVSSIIDRKLLVVDLKAILYYGLDIGSICIRIFREAKLLNLSLYFDSNELFNSQEQHINQLWDVLIKNAQENSELIFISSKERIYQKSEPGKKPVIEIEFNMPDFKLRCNIWNHFLSIDDKSIVADLAGKFKLTEEDIAGAISLVEQKAKISPWEHELYDACKQQSNHNLNKLARKIKHNFTFDDIILPKNVKDQLKDIIAYSENQQLVYTTWNFNQKFPYGKGLSILFSGPSGTGKTMAAGIIANNLGLDAYHIDLATIVSKYIGETEKNLANVFSEATNSNAILFFDEADALFGKRTEVKDAHDRFANIEISYLLQMMEEYDGMTILTTNFRDNIDDAFTRRLKFIIEFPFPDEQYRKIIWKNSFTEEVPMMEDIDFNFIAKKVKSSGGEIKLMAMMAAIFAARNKKEVGMTEILLAVKREYQRTGKRFLESDFKPYFNLIKDEDNLQWSYNQVQQ